MDGEIPGVDDAEDDTEKDETPGVDREILGVNDSEGDTKAHETEGDDIGRNEDKDNKESNTRASGSMNLRRR